jgi:hypothetical protein
MKTGILNAPLGPRPGRLGEFDYHSRSLTVSRTPTPVHSRSLTVSQPQNASQRESTRVNASEIELSPLNAPPRCPRLSPINS